MKEAEEMSERIAAGMIKKCRNAAATRRMIAAVEAEQGRAYDARGKASMDAILALLREHLTTFPAEPERYP